jgi:putative phosphoribosyl transferase
MKTSLSPYAEYDVAIPCGIATLKGHLNIPARSKGLVIFAHGSGSSRNSPRNRSVAWELNHRGLATLLFDLLTPEEAENEATSAALRFDIPLLTGRLVAATRWAQKEESLSRLAIGYFGASTGAAAAIAAAVDVPEIFAVVSRGGRSDLAGNAIQQLKAPTLFIAGEHDEPVVKWNHDSYERLSCTKEFTLVTGADHLFSEPGTLEKVAALAGEWFEKHLGDATRKLEPN